MKNQLIRLLVVFPILLLCGAAQNPKPESNLHPESNLLTLQQDKAVSAFPETPVFIRQDTPTFLLARRSSRDRSGQAQECTWLGINCE